MLHAGKIGTLRGKFAYVGASGKIASLATQHNAAQRLVGGKLGENSLQLLPHEYSNGVQAAGMAERHEGNGAVVVEQYPTTRRAGFRSAHRNLRFMHSLGLPAARCERLSSS